MKRRFDDLSDSSGGEPPQKRPRAFEDSDDSLAGEDPQQGPRELKSSDDSLSDVDPQQKPWEFEDSDSVSDGGPQQRPRALDESDCSLADEDPQVLKLGLALTDEICELIPDGADDALNKIIRSVLSEFLYEAWCEITNELLPADDGGAAADSDVSMQGAEEKVSWTTVGPLLTAAAHGKFPEVIRKAMAGDILDFWIEDIELMLGGMVHTALYENEHRPRDERLFKDLIGDSSELREKFQDAMTEEVLGIYLRAVIGVVDEHLRTVCAENEGKTGPVVLRDILDEQTYMDFHDAIVEVADEDLPPLGLSVCWALSRRLEEVMRGPDPSGCAEEAGGGSSSDTAVTCDQMMEGLTLDEREGGQVGSDEDADGEYDKWESGDGEESSGEEREYDGDTEVGHDGDESSYGWSGDEEEDSDTDRGYEGEDEDDEDGSDSEDHEGDESDSEEHEENGQVDETGQDESRDVSMGGI